MVAFVGLGNPGIEYVKTKHNIGFWVINAFAKRYNLSFQPGKAEYLYNSYKKKDVLVVKPTTGMNNSGLAVKDISSFLISPQIIYS